MLTLRTARGRSLPLGATALADGINFALLCRHGTAVWLVLYSMEGEVPLAEISLDPWKNRTGNHWHVLVAGLPNTFRYGRRVETVKNCSIRRSLFFRRPFVWHDDVPPLTPLEDSVIYEVHVRGFTCHPTSGVAHPGTFAGLIDKIPYLQELG